MPYKIIQGPAGYVEEELNSLDENNRLEVMSTTVEGYRVSVLVYVQQITQV